jgi:hypothetical protein
VRSIAFLTDLAAAAELLRRALVLVDPLLRWWVCGEHSIQPALFLRALVEQAHEGFLQRHGALHVVASKLHVLHAVLVRFELLVTAILHLNHLRAGARALTTRLATACIHTADCHADLCDGEPGLHDRAALLRLRAVTRRGVHDFMAQNGGQLGFVVERSEQPAIDCNLAAGECPGIGHRVVEHG